MSEQAQILPTNEGLASTGESDAQRTSLRVVPPIASEPESSGFLAAFVKGSIIGAVGVFIFAVGMALHAGGSTMDALGLGAFCAFWGGPGFGGAIGASVHRGPDDH